MPLAVAIVFIASIFVQYPQMQGKLPMRSDAAGYYCYLPAVFIYHDLNFGYLRDPEFIGKYKAEFGYHPENWFLNSFDGYKITKYPSGPAICEAPFFLLACAFTKFSSYDMDGYSFWFRVFYIMATLFFAFLGLFYLYKLLRLFVDTHKSVFITCVIALATNFYYYACVWLGSAHIFNFFFCACFMYNWFKFMDKFEIKRLMLMALLFGMIVLMRPTDCILALFPFMLLVTSKKLKDFFMFLKDNLLKTAVAIILFFVPILIQMTFWKLATGHWVCYSYQDEGFDFLHPHIWGGLFSFHKGWLLYTPIMAFALYGMFKYCKREFYVSLTATLLVFWFIVFSWWSWWYGGSFGCRVMILFYPVLAIPMAKMFDSFETKKSRIAAYSVVAIFIAWNILQSYQVQAGILGSEYNDFEIYKNSLFRVR